MTFFFSPPAVAPTTVVELPEPAGASKRQKLFFFKVGGGESELFLSLSILCSQQDMERKGDGGTHQVKSEVSTTASPILVRLEERGFWLVGRKKKKKMKRRRRRRRRSEAEEERGEGGSAFFPAASFRSAPTRSLSRLRKKRGGGGGRRKN